jgi:uncharacterized HhH-GPD family protein
VPDRLYFTDSDEANALIASDPMALLIGFELDQRVTVETAFRGPLALRERVGTLDAGTLAAVDLEPMFRSRPVIHRYPKSMARRVSELAAHVRDRYDGDAGRVWTDATVLAKRFGVEAARDLVPWHPTLGDVDSPEALAAYVEEKRVHKAEWAKTPAGV